MTLTPEVEQVDARTLTVAVTVRTNDIGHDFPTGFAFARQWWLEVTAQTQNGDPVCLSPVDPVTGLDDPAWDRLALLVRDAQHAAGRPADL